MVYNWTRKCFAVLVILLLSSLIIIYATMKQTALRKHVDVLLSPFKTNGLTDNLTNVVEPVSSFMKLAEQTNKQIPKAECIGRTYLVYNCERMCGGLGDRQRGIISTFLLALLTNRTFVLQMKQPCDIENFLKPGIYDWTKCKSYVTQFKVSQTNYISAIDRPTNLIGLAAASNFDSWAQHVLYINTNILMIDTIRKNPNVPKMITWLNTMSHEEVIRYVLHLLFQPSSRLSENLTSFIAEHAEEKQLACAHIRYGKNPSVPQDGGRNMDQSKVNMIFSFLQQYNNKDKYVMYVATDNFDIRKDAKKNFTNAISTDGIIVHIDRPHLSAKESCEGFYTALFEQYLLSKCDVLLLTKSGFGAMAAYMRGHSDNLFYYDANNNTVSNVALTSIKPFCRPI